MGCLHIDHRVESARFKRQMFGVARLEGQAVHPMMFLAKSNGCRIQVQRSVAPGLKSSCNIGGATAMTAAHFQNIFPLQRHLRSDMMIRLDTGAIRFVLRRERDGHGRLLFEGIVQKKHIFTAKTPRKERIPGPPDGFANPTDREKIINNHHRTILTAKAARRIGPSWRAICSWGDHFASKMFMDSSQASIESL